MAEKSDSFKIRLAVREDSKIIFGFIKAIAEYEKMSDEVECDEKQIEKSIFDEGGAEVIIGEENGMPVGFALFFHNYSTFKGRKGLYLEDLFVNPEMRGKGYGKALILELAKIAHERGCGRMDWCCLDWNQPSIDFYRSINALPMDSWTIYRLTEEELAKY